MQRTHHTVTRKGETVSVSLIIPAYNAEKYIGFTIESLIRQSHAELEIIVVDDGSTDRTREIACRYAETDDRMTVLPQKNLGVATARNTGIEVAKGEFVGFIDADDIWHSTAVAKMLIRFEGASPNLGVVYTWSADIDEENRVTGGVHASKARGHVYPLLVFHNFLGNASSTIIRKRCLEEVGGCRPEFDLGCEDFDLYLRLASRFEFDVVPEFLVAYRRTPEAMSSHAERMNRAHHQVLDKVRCERPAVSPRLLRSSKVNFYAYLAHSAGSGGNAGDPLHWIRKSFRTDPILALCRIDLLAIILRQIRLRGAGDVARPAGHPDRGNILDQDRCSDASSSFHPPTSGRILAQIKCILASMVYRVLRWGRPPPSSAGR
jgi:glycosyltransferase involved in cell wall biosynthesis